MRKLVAASAVFCLLPLAEPAGGRSILADTSPDAEGDLGVDYFDEHRQQASLVPVTPFRLEDTRPSGVKVGSLDG